MVAPRRTNGVNIRKIDRSRRQSVAMSGEAYGHAEGGAFIDVVNAGAQEEYRSRRRRAPRTLPRCFAPTHRPDSEVHGEISSPSWSFRRIRFFIALSSPLRSALPGRDS